MWRTILILAALVLATFAVTEWWIERGANCDAQEVHALSGACKVRVKRKAEEGDVVAQWTYGLHLLESEPSAARQWLRGAARQSRTGMDVYEMPGLCRTVFDPADVENTLLRVVRSSPDAHLLLFGLYLDRHCGVFSLDKASEQIPMLTQCASNRLTHFLDAVGRTSHAVSADTVLAIQVNLRRCRADMLNPPLYPKRTVGQFIAPRAEELAAIEARLASLLTVNQAAGQSLLRTSHAASKP